MAPHFSFAVAWICVAAAPSLSLPLEGAFRRLVDEHYPSQYVVLKLREAQQITIDGALDEAAWAEVPWLDGFLDLAGPRFQGQGSHSWQEASREYARLFTGDTNPTRVKVRWDADFLYVGAELKSRHVAASVTGHCDDLSSDVWKGTPVLPYFDDDFEVFVDPSQNNYYYVEFEMNAKNASYDTLWTLPQSGLGSIAPECGGGDGPRKTCCNTTWNHGNGLCDKDFEHEAPSWTMEMYDAASRPGSGMHSASRNNTDSWTLEIRFPMVSTQDHGGLINLEPGSHYPGSDPRSLHPLHGQRFWWATFANALHAPWWASLNATSTQHPELIKARCDDVIAADKKRNGFSQFLIDGNNAAPTCYYEAASQHLGGHQYMHNPDNFGYFQFATEQAPVCRNVQWLARFVLAQVYQAEVQYLTNVKLGNGSFTSRPADLIAASACTIDNACNATALAQALQSVKLEISAEASKKSGLCARYAVGAWQSAYWTGGPCFTAHVSYVVQGRHDSSRSRRIAGSINEARLLVFEEEVGQSLDDPDADWLCMDTVELDKDTSSVIVA